jgi:hypothetical protein
LQFGPDDDIVAQMSGEELWLLYGGWWGLSRVFHAVPG